MRFGSERDGNGEGVLRFWLVLCWEKGCDGLLFVCPDQLNLAVQKRPLLVNGPVFEDRSRPGCFASRPVSRTG
jgi:hypothetical protein